jgi:hypothetical protein
MQNLFAIIEGESLSLLTGFEASGQRRAGQGEVNNTVFDSFASRRITEDMKFSMVGVYKPFCQCLCMIC